MIGWDGAKQRPKDWQKPATMDCRGLLAGRLGFASGRAQAVFGVVGVEPQVAVGELVATQPLDVAVGEADVEAVVVPALRPRSVSAKFFIW